MEAASGTMAAAPDAGMSSGGATDVSGALPAYDSDIYAHQPGAQPREPAAGDILKGRYRLEERIGRGGMGTVFRATDLEAVRLGHGAGSVAIKVLNAELGSHEAALFDEVQRTRRLQQENIVNVYSFEPGEACGFMVMELLSGISLDRFVSGSWPQGVPLRLAFPTIKGMGMALSYAHRDGVIHSDFKPTNVQVGPGPVKVLDFGIARAARSDAPPRHGPPTGITPAYASCEMLEELPADPRDDVFCFALVVYFLLSGSHPFNGLPATEARDLSLPVTPIAGLSRTQNAALERALRFARAERSPSVEDLVAALAPRGRARHVRAAALGAGALLAGAAGLAWLVQDNDSGQELVGTLCPAAAAGRHGADAADPADAKLVATLIAQGNSYLAHGLNPFDAGMLSENVSSALGAFQSALALAPGRCEAAAQGVAKVATAYLHEAQRRYAAGDYRGAAATAALGLAIWKDSRELRVLRERALSRLASAGP